MSDPTEYWSALARERLRIARKSLTSDLIIDLVELELRRRSTDGDWRGLGEFDEASLMAVSYELNRRIPSP